MCIRDRAYYNVPVSEETKKYFTITCPFGNYSFNYLIQGHKCSSSAFQRFMSILLGDLRNVFVYLDDILIASSTLEEHVAMLEKVLERLKYMKIYLNPEKCVLAVEETDFLGFNVSEKGVKPSKEKIDAVVNVARPTTIKQLRAFLGLYNFCRINIVGAAQLLQPLTKMLKGKLASNKKISWGVEADRSFREAKAAMVSATLLSFPDERTELLLYTKVSELTIASALMGEWEKKMIRRRFSHSTVPY